MKISKIRVFSAPAWCRPCQQYHPIVEEAKKLTKYSDIAFEIYDVDDEDSTELCKEYNIRSVPTTLFIGEDNNVIDKIVGSVSLKPLCDKIDSIINGTK